MLLQEVLAARNQWNINTSQPMTQNDAKKSKGRCIDSG